MPSPACEISRVANNRRKSRPASTPRKSAQTADLDPLATPSSLGGALLNRRRRAGSTGAAALSDRRGRAGPGTLSGDFAADELFDQVPADVVAVLLRR